MADHKLSSDSCWDLNAIVRSCCHSSTNDTTSTTTINTTTRVPLHEIATSITTDVVDSSNSGTSSETTLSILSSLKFEEEDDRFLFPNLVQEPDNGFDELHDCLKQFYSNNNNNRISSTPVIQQQDHQCQPEQQQPPRLPPLSLPTMTTTTTALAAPLFVFGEPQLQNQQPPQPLRLVQPSRSSRKRKAPQKRLVCHVTEENLSSDFWAWRKYGQKPIKGSPYPRNYYRCSSSKGCGARKQVERSNTDPNVFIVSYTGDHAHPRPTHRNSLAGSSRSKFPRTQNNPVAEAEGPAPQPSAAEPMAMEAEVALAEEQKTDAGEFYEGEAGAGSEDEEIDDDDLLIPNPSAAFNEDPFSGLDELHVRNSSSSGASGGC